MFYTCFLCCLLLFVYLKYSVTLLPTELKAVYNYNIKKYIKINIKPKFKITI